MNFIPNLFIIPVGLIVGILVAAPVGPVNVLCIQRAIERGVLAGVVAGLGAVLGDGVVATMAALSVGSIINAFETYGTAIQLIGGLALLAFGWHLYHSPPVANVHLEQGMATDSKPMNGGVRLWDVPKSFFLTVSNPGAVLGLLTIIGGISTFVEIRGTGDALLLVATIMCGSMVWWIGLSTFVSSIRERLSMAALRKINVYAGVALVAFGLLLVGELAYKYLAA